MEAEADDDWDAILAAELQELEEADSDDGLEDVIQAARLLLEESRDNAQATEPWTSFLQSAQQHEHQLGELMQSEATVDSTASSTEEHAPQLAVESEEEEQPRVVTELTPSDFEELKIILENIVLAACDVHDAAPKDVPDMPAPLPEHTIFLKSDSDNILDFVVDDHSAPSSPTNGVVEPSSNSIALEAVDEPAIRQDAFYSSETGRLDAVLEHAEAEMAITLKKKEEELEQRRRRRQEEIEQARRRAEADAAAQAARIEMEIQLMLTADAESLAHEEALSKMVALARMESVSMAGEDMNVYFEEEKPISSSEPLQGKSPELRISEHHDGAQLATLEEAPPPVVLQAIEIAVESCADACDDTQLPAAPPPPVPQLPTVQLATSKVAAGWGGRVERRPAEPTEKNHLREMTEDASFKLEERECQPQESERASNDKVEHRSGTEPDILTEVASVEAPEKLRFQEIRALCERYWKKFSEQTAQPDSSQPRINSECHALAASLVQPHVTTENVLPSARPSEHQQREDIEWRSFEIWRRWIGPKLKSRTPTSSEVSPIVGEVTAQQPLSISTLEVAEICVEDLCDLNIFHDCTGLRKLQLNINKLSSLQGLERLSKIEELSVQDNVLTDISALSSLPALQDLFLGVNAISSLEPISKLPVLRHVSVTVNRVEHFPLLESPLLQRLELYHNRIQSLPDNALSRLESLTHLDLAKNQLSTISGEMLSACPSLTHLILSQNCLTQFPSPLFLPLLRVLWLSGNQLSSCDAWTPCSGVFHNNDAAPAMGAFLPSLDHLYLQGNQLRDIPPEVFRGMPALRKLDISFNNIESLDFVVGLRDYLQCLTNLHASDNPVAADGSFISRVVAYCPQLKECNGAQIMDQHVAQAWDLILEDLQQQPHWSGSWSVLQDALASVRNAEGWAAIQKSSSVLAKIVAASAPPHGFCRRMLPVLGAMAEEHNDQREKYKLSRSANWAQTAAAQLEFSHEWHALVGKQLHRLVHWEAHRHSTMRLIEPSPSLPNNQVAQGQVHAVGSLDMLLSLIEEEHKKANLTNDGGVESGEQHELHAAAAKVQSMFRGFHVRRSLKAALESAKYIDNELDDMMNFGLDDVLDFSAPELDANWMTSAFQTGVGVRAPLSPSETSADEEEAADLAAPVVFGDHKRPHHSHAHHQQSQPQDEKDIVEEVVSVASGSDFSDLPASKKTQLSSHKEALMAEWGFTNPHVASAMMKRARRLNHFQRAAQRKQEHKQPKLQRPVDNEGRQTIQFTQPPINPARRIASSRSDDTEMRRVASGAAAGSSSRSNRVQFALPKQSLGVDQN